MKIVEVYKKTDRGYKEVCQFARRIYRKKLSFTISHFPEYFFAITDESGIAGCIGLNSALSSPLFLNDTRIQKIVRSSGMEVRFCEQSIFAIDRYALGVPLLIAAVTEYANSIGAQKLVYAGIDVSRKTIAHFGFLVTECGPVDLSTLPFADRKKYELWSQTENPVTCILDTNEAPSIARLAFGRHSHRVRRSEKLTSSLFENLALLQQKEVCCS